MDIIHVPVHQLPTAESVTNADHILIYRDADGKAYLAAGTLFRGDPGQNATINGETAITIAAGDNISLSQEGGTLTVSSTLRGAYQVKGSATLATLPTLTAANEGFVYDMSEAFTTTADFREGAGKAYPAGTNVVVASVGSNAYKYDVLSGFVDLSGYVQTTRQINGHALSADVTLTKSDVGLGNVDNTSDLNKPISTAAQTALDAKQDKLTTTGAANQGVYVSASGVVSAMAHTLDADVPANAVFTDTTYTPASAAPLMDGTAAVGTSAKYARQDHVHPSDTSRASAADVAAIKALLQNAVFYRTASGNPVTFSDGYAENLRRLSVTVTATQSGSGDPSPTNPRPISGVSSVTVTRTGTGGANSASVTVSLVDANSDPLTVYGATLNVTTGTLAVTHRLWILKNFSKTQWTLYNDAFYVNFSGRLPSLSGDYDAKSNVFRFGGHISSGNSVDKTFFGFFPMKSTTVSPSRIYFTAPGNTTVDDFVDFCATNDAVLTTPLATPVTYQLTAQQLAALSGYNAVSADAGTLEIEYRADTSTIGGGI